MKTSTLLIGGAVVGVGGFLAYRAYMKRKAEEAAAGGAAVCEKLPPPYNAYCMGAVQALPVVEEIYDRIEEAATPYKDDERANASNGAVAAARGATAKLYTGAGGDKTCGYASREAGFTDDAFRYANGCVPVRGAPGWEKCAPGTVDICKNPAGGPTAEWNCAKTGTRTPGDPLTRPVGKLCDGKLNDNQARHWREAAQAQGYGDNCPLEMRWLYDGRLVCRDAPEEWVNAISGYTPETPHSPPPTDDIQRPRNSPPPVATPPPVNPWNPGTWLPVVVRPPTPTTPAPSRKLPKLTNPWSDM